MMTKGGRNTHSSGIVDLRSVPTWKEYYLENSSRLKEQCKF